MLIRIYVMTRMYFGLVVCIGYRLSIHVLYEYEYYDDGGGGGGYPLN